MAKTIMNEADLEATLSNIARDVIYEVTEKTYDRLQEIIQEKVYDAHIPNWYARLEDDGGLKGAWVYNVEGGKKTITGEDLLEDNQLNTSLAILKSLIITPTLLLGRTKNLRMMR